MIAAGGAAFNGRSAAHAGALATSATATAALKSLVFMATPFVPPSVAWTHANDGPQAKRTSYVSVSCEKPIGRRPSFLGPGRIGLGAQRTFRFFGAIYGN